MGMSFTELTLGDSPCTVSCTAFWARRDKNMFSRWVCRSVSVVQAHATQAARTWQDTHFDNQTLENWSLSLCSSCPKVLHPQCPSSTGESLPCKRHRMSYTLSRWAFTFESNHTLSDVSLFLFSWKPPRSQRQRFSLVTRTSRCMKTC